MAAYSKWGRTNDLYMTYMRFDSLGGDFQISTEESKLLAFAVTLLMWVLNLMSEVRVRQRYLTESVLWRGWSCSLYDFNYCFASAGSHGKTLVCIKLHKPSLFPRADRIKVRLEKFGVFFASDGAVNNTVISK